VGAWIKKLYLQAAPQQKITGAEVRLAVYEVIKAYNINCIDK
jgi:hypothetical protein